MIAESFTWLPSHVGISFENSLKIYSVDFTIQQWYLCESKKKKKKEEKIPKFLFLSLSSIFKICQRKQETVKRVSCHESMCHEGMYHEGMCKLDNLFIMIITNTFISFGESGWGITSTLLLPRLDAFFAHVRRFPSILKQALIPPENLIFLQ